MASYIERDYMMIGELEEVSAGVPTGSFISSHLSFSFSLSTYPSIKKHYINLSLASLI